MRKLWTNVQWFTVNTGSKPIPNRGPCECRCGNRGVIKMGQEWFCVDHHPFWKRAKQK